MTPILTQFSRLEAPTLSVYDAGGNGLPVIFLHGLCGDAGQTSEAFPNNTRFRRITIESRGHGSSEPGDPQLFSIRTFASDIAAFIERYQLAPVVIGGISMGAAISLHLAVHRPEFLRGLILVRPAWITEPAPPNNYPNALVGRLLAEFSPEAARNEFEASETAQQLAEVAPDNLASLRGFFTRKPHAITAALLKAIANDGPGVSEDDLRHLQVPSLIIGNDHDYIHPLDYAVKLAQRIPGAQFIQITAKAVNKAGYLEDLHRTITRFLETCPG